MILIFRRKGDTFFYPWIEMNGIEGVTNYIHQIGAGHLADFLVIYHNLYKYSQQSWEFGNHRAYGIYHKHSQRGGHGAKDDLKSHIVPIFRYCTRM